MMESLNLRHLRSVAAIARLGSLSAAASQVNISQPAVTQGLSKLEAQLGIALFHRLPEGMQPTEAAAVWDLVTTPGSYARLPPAPARFAIGNRVRARRMNPPGLPSWPPPPLKVTTPVALMSNLLASTPPRL